MSTRLAFALALRFVTTASHAADLALKPTDLVLDDGRKVYAAGTLLPARAQRPEQIRIRRRVLLARWRDLVRQHPGRTRPHPGDQRTVDEVMTCAASCRPARSH